MSNAIRLSLKTANEIYSALTFMQEVVDNDPSIKSETKDTLSAAIAACSAMLEENVPVAYKYTEEGSVEEEIVGLDPLDFSNPDYSDLPLDTDEEEELDYGNTQRKQRDFWEK